jgi:hypothetical protein
MARKTADPTFLAANGVWRSPPHLKEVFVTLTLGWSPMKIWVFIANIANEFILGLDMLHAYDASVDLERQTLRLAEEEVSLWSPGAGPQPSSLVVAKNQVIPAQFEGILITRLESPLGVENGLVEQSPQAHPPEGIYIARTFVQDCQEVPLRALNAMHWKQKLMRGSPLAHGEPVTMVAPPSVEQPQCKEPTSEEMESGAEHQEDPKEDAAVKPVGGLRNRNRDQNLAAKRSGQPEEQTRGNCGARNELAPASRKMTGHAGGAQHKANFIRKHSIRDNVEQETWKGQTEEKRRWKGPECKTGIKDPGTRRQLRIKIERTSDGFDRKAFGLEFMKGVAGMSSRLQQIRNWSVWRGLSPPDRKNLLETLEQEEPDMWEHRPI